MEKFLYIVDITSRQYGFPIGAEGLPIRINGVEYTIYDNAEAADVIGQALIPNSVLSIPGARGSAVFQTSHLIGAFIRPE